ncbi:MAG: hypothetical protein U0414_17740 [Polyangiaceae bacterium]
MTGRNRGLQIWGGVECTVNRVGDRWFDQIELSGHATRDDDLRLVRDLGIQTLRYPLLWERAARAGAEHDFQWMDRRLALLRELDMHPIAGLVHHGSGPAHTHLLDPAFPTHLAAYAGEVAARYPWIRDYTPINETVTTARFSALYGHWYPHARCTRAFVRALLTEVQATVLAMRAIRRVCPDAQLVQTEDGGAVFATPTLQYQADFENERRWLGLDLLFGRVDRHHPLHRFLIEHGAKREELLALERDPCPPDVVGLNYYVTSDRFLDDRVHLIRPIVGAETASTSTPTPRRCVRAGRASWVTRSS